MRSKTVRSASRGGRLPESFLQGVTLGLNALPDAALHCDGLDEFLPTAASIQGRHDLCSTLDAPRGAPAFVVEPGRSGDLVDGYGAVLETLAAQVRFDGVQPVKGRVALVGYMMDRNEGDHRGNVRELERMIRALDLDPVSIWLSGRCLEHLRLARGADAIISLPHGRAAARILAERLGVKLVEAGLPFGLAATRRFVELLGREFGRRAPANAFIEAELDEVIPRLQWSVPHAFLNRGFSFTGDSHYAPAFAEFIDELGGKAAAPGDADLVVANTAALEKRGAIPACLEFGFPSDCSHFLEETPFLGFPGALAFASRMANAVVKGFYLRRGER